MHLGDGAEGDRGNSCSQGGSQENTDQTLTKVLVPDSWELVSWCSRMGCRGLASSGRRDVGLRDER